jgi:hypothetical protein
MLGNQDWSSQFNSLQAYVDITKRIFFEGLLPPHSRTLNFTAMKDILNVTAMLSNRKVSELYRGFNDSNVDAIQKATLGSAEIRQKKRDIQEYVDRCMCIKDFLEQEFQSSAFYPAFVETNNYILRNGGKDNFMGKCAPPTLQWKPKELSAVLASFADYRSNINSDDLKVLHKRSNWYTKQQCKKPEDVHVPGGTISKNTTKQRAAPVDMLNLHKKYLQLLNELNNLTKLLVTAHETWKKETKAAIKQSAFIEKERLYAQYHELVTRFHTLYQPPGAHAAPAVVFIDKFDKMLNNVFKEVLKPATNPPAPAGQVPFALSDLIKEVQDEIRNTNNLLTPTPPAPPFSATDSTVYKLFKFLERQLASNPAPSSSLLEPREDRRNFCSLTLFDIAILGGLAPRTFALVTNSDANPFADDFFERCMELFDTRILRLQAESLSSGGFDRDIDLGLLLFNLPITNYSKHTSYFHFERPQQMPSSYMFGAPKNKTSAAGGGNGGEGGIQTERDIRTEYKRERDLYASTKYPGVFELERFCLQCLEKGTELYIRLVHEMIKDDLKKKQDEAKLDSDFVRSFAKVVGLIMQRSEVDNPMILSSAPLIKRRKTENSYALIEAKYQLAQACGFRPDVSVDSSLIV